MHLGLVVPRLGRGDPGAVVRLHHLDGACVGPDDRVQRGPFGLQRVEALTDEGRRLRRGRGLLGRRLDLVEPDDGLRSDVVDDLPLGHPELVDLEPVDGGCGLVAVVAVRTESRQAGGVPDEQRLLHLADSGVLPVLGAGDALRPVDGDRLEQRVPGEELGCEHADLLVTVERGALGRDA